MIDYQQIQNLEIELASVQIRSNTERLNQLIADGFLQIGGSGKMYNKALLLKQLSNNTAVYRLSDFVFQSLAHDCVLVKYRSDMGGVQALRSSIWIIEQGSWKLVHHQATPIQA